MHESYHLPYILDGVLSGVYHFKISLYLILHFHQITGNDLLVVNGGASLGVGYHIIDILYEDDC